MANIMDYLEWRGDLDFRKAPFNEVDNLILTQIVYLDLDGVVPGIDRESKVTVAEAGQRYFHKYPIETVNAMPRLKKNASFLLNTMMKSERFKNCYLSKYVEDISVEEESQFSAMKIDLDDGSVFLSFSGTDNTVVGWKENFNMSYLTETPGQKKAVRYVQETVPFYKNKLRFGGHSKGGNLAVYAAMCAKRSIQNRLIAIYNNDGPGFTRKMICENGYQAVMDRIHTILPQSSVVGMLLEHEEDMEIIQSSNTGLMQHDAFSWEVKGPAFVHMDDLEEDSIYLDRTLKSWIGGLNDGQRRQFVEALFGILENAQITDLDQLGKIKFGQLLELWKALEGLEPESKAALKDTLFQLFETAVRMRMQEKEQSELDE